VLRRGIGVVALEQASEHPRPGRGASVAT
jgi:hypothetical protein